MAVLLVLLQPVNQEPLRRTLEIMLALHADMQERSKKISGAQQKKVVGLETLVIHNR